MNRRDGERRIFNVLIIVIILFLILAIIGPRLELNSARGEESPETYEMYVICMKNDYINIRMKPSTRSEAIGYLLCGDKVELDGKKKNGFLHLVGITEYGEGWVYGGYLADEPPVDLGGARYSVTSNGRVACRKTIGGKRRCWVYTEDSVKVWYWTEEWCLTNKGFIQTRYLEEDHA